MDNNIINPSTIRKHKSRKNELAEHRKTCLAKEREKKHQRKAVETAEEQDARRKYNHEQKCLKLADKTNHMCVS